MIRRHVREDEGESRGQLGRRSRGQRSQLHAVGERVVGGVSYKEGERFHDPCA